MRFSRRVKRLEEKLIKPPSAIFAPSKQDAETQLQQHYEKYPNVPDPYIFIYDPTIKKPPPQRKIGD